MMETGDRRRYRAAVERLFAYMSRRGIQGTWLAARLCVSKQTIYRYRSGVRSMPLVRFKAACRALEVPPEKFGWQMGARRSVKRAS